MSGPVTAVIWEPNMEARVTCDARDRADTPDRAERTLARENIEPAADARLAVPSKTVLRGSSEHGCWWHVLRAPSGHARGDWCVLHTLTIRHFLGHSRFGIVPRLACPSTVRSWHWVGLCADTTCTRCLSTVTGVPLSRPA